MSSRARVFAAVMLFVSGLLSLPMWAQAQNLEAGKSASQIFAGTCTACHKSPRGLLKTVSPGALADFLREHYTTGGDMASQLAAYLISNGAGDKQAKQGADKPGASGDQPERQGRKNRNAPAQEAARPDDTTPLAEGGRQGRRHQATPGQLPDEGKPGTAPAQTATERGPDGRKPSAKQRNKPGRRPDAEEPSVANEPPKAEPKTEPNTEPAKADSGPNDKAQSEPKGEMGNAGSKPDAMSTPSDEAKSEPVKSDAAKVEPKDNAVSGDKAAVRRDPAPAEPPVAASAPAPTSAVAIGGSSEASVPQGKAPAPSEPPAVNASAPPPSHAAGPPAPPISQ